MTNPRQSSRNNGTYQRERMNDNNLCCRKSQSKKKMSNLPFFYHGVIELSYLRRLLGVVLNGAAEVSQIASDAAKETAEVVKDVAKTVTEKKPTTA
jgi:hypothetical protein